MSYLMRLLVAVFVLLLGSDANVHARIPVQRHQRSHPSIGAANQSVLLSATAVVPTAKDVDTARPQLLASEASLYDRRPQSARAPSRDFMSLCSYECTTGRTARPPPFQS